MEPDNPPSDRRYPGPCGIQPQDCAGHGHDDACRRGCRSRHAGHVKGSACGFIEHRGITHTFVAIPAMAGLVVGLIWLVDALWQRLRRRRKLPPASGAAMGMAVPAGLHGGALPSSAGFYQQLRGAALLSLLAPLVCVGHRLHLRAADACGAACGAGAAVAVWLGKPGDWRRVERSAGPRRGRLRRCCSSWFCGECAILNTGARWRHRWRGVPG